MTPWLSTYPWPSPPAWAVPLFNQVLVMGLVVVVLGTLAVAARGRLRRVLIASLVAFALGAGFAHAQHALQPTLVIVDDPNQIDPDVLIDCTYFWFAWECWIYA